VNDNPPAPQTDRALIWALAIVAALELTGWLVIIGSYVCTK
jgi:hypothetical protein